MKAVQQDHIKMKLAMSLILLSLVGCPVSYAQFANAIENEAEIIETLRKGLNAKTLRRIRGGKNLMGDYRIV